ncbi:DUF2267 domain-containing protein [Chloroflexi bacterium TSY]|nr:DUF2267 domain-containing protein [Chloroflexi bacterium TSY]
MSQTGFRGFDHTVHETNTWLHEISDVMGHPDRQVAYHALRGVLFALRDRLTVAEALNLSAQLPMLIRGIYFEGYKASGKPEKFHLDEFLARVSKELRSCGRVNPERVTRAVFQVLERHVTAGEIEDIRTSLPRDIRRLWPEQMLEAT